MLTEFTAEPTNEAVPYALLGEIALRQKRYAEAIEQTNSALEIDPKATKLYAQLADAYTGAGNAKAAADARAKAGDGVPALGDPIGLGLVQMQAQRRSAARPSAARTPHRRRAALTDGTALADAGARSRVPACDGQYDAARQKLDSAMRTRSNDAELLEHVRACRGSRRQSDAGEIARAVARSRRIRRDPAAQFALGCVLEMIERRSRRAGARTRSRSSIDPKSPSASIALGDVLMRNGRYDEAAARYRALTRPRPATPKRGRVWWPPKRPRGKCDAAIRDINAALAKDARNGILMQLFVRLTSTCPASSAEEKRMALDYGDKIYQQSDAAPIAEAYALALAANGKWDDAVKIQQGAMFVLVRNGRSGELPAYRDFLQQFQAHKLPDKPWPAMSGLPKPARPGAGCQGAAPPAR